MESADHIVGQSAMYYNIKYSLIKLSNWCFFRASFELEPGAIGQTTDFKEANRRLEWSLKKAIISY